MEINQQESKKTNVEKFLESCTDQELMFLLRFTKAQMEDRIALMIAMQDHINAVQEMDFDGMVNSIIAQNAEPVDPEKLIPEEIKQKITYEIRSEQWTSGIDWEAERRKKRKL